MKCARCGSPLDDQAMVCGQCGAVVGMSYGPPQPRAKPQSQAMRPQPLPAQPFAPKPMAPPAVGGSGRSVPLAGRVKGIMKTPRREWPVIASESTSAGHIYTGYAMPLAAVGAIALFLSYVLAGPRMPILSMLREHAADGLVGALLAFAFALAHLYLLTRAVELIARRVGAQCDRLQALKLVAYSYTPIWLAGIAYLFPALSILWLVAAGYALWLAFVGAPLVMRCPPAQAAKLALFAGLAAFVLASVMDGILAALLGLGSASLDWLMASAV
ncbi:MAG: YIP1 family protein [Burkholderiales bacterium]|nr:YIP1 family protein [Burkholderiales bacterium]